MTLDTQSWHFCALSEEIPDNRITERSIGEKQVCLLRRDGRLFAFAAKCPHASGRFCEGWVDGMGRIVCPEHKYRFNPANGLNTSGEGYKLRTWQTKEEEGRIFVLF